MKLLQNDRKDTKSENDATLAANTQSDSTLFHIKLKNKTLKTI